MPNSARLHEESAGQHHPPSGRITLDRIAITINPDRSVASPDIADVRLGQTGSLEHLGSRRSR